MAFLRKWISKGTFALITGMWTLISTGYFLSPDCPLPPYAKSLIVGAGSLIIVWIGVESGQTPEKTSETPQS